MHVRISDRGWELLNNKELANKVADAIVRDKDKLENGQHISVEQGKVSVQMVTSIKEKNKGNK